MSGQEFYTKFQGETLDKSFTTIFREKFLAKEAEQSLLGDISAVYSTARCSSSVLAGPNPHSLCLFHYTLERALIFLCIGITAVFCYCTDSRRFLRFVELILMNKASFSQNFIIFTIFLCCLISTIIKFQTFHEKHEKTRIFRSLS